MDKLRNHGTIRLQRIQNGWLVHDGEYLSNSKLFFAFESTESLRDQLVDLIGQSGWRVSVPQKEVKMPARGKGGKFLPKNGVDGTPKRGQNLTRSQA